MKKNEKSELLNHEKTLQKKEQTEKRMEKEETREAYAEFNE